MKQEESRSQMQPEQKLDSERKSLFNGLFLFKLVLCVIVIVVALIVWKIKSSESTDSGSHVRHNERIHITIDYDNFLCDEKIILPFSDEVFVGLRLAKTYPSGTEICFRFDAFLCVKEERHIGEFVVRAIPKIVGEQIELGEWMFGSFDVESSSVNQVQSFNTTGEAVFAMFKHKIKANAIPIFNKASKIVQMTSAEIVVQ